MDFVNYSNINKGLGWVPGRQSETRAQGEAWAPRRAGPRAGGGPQDGRAPGPVPGQGGGSQGETLAKARRGPGRTLAQG